MVRTRPTSEVADLITNLPASSAIVRSEMGDLADWSVTDANLADLVDLMHYWLSSEYTKWTTDPEDPEVKAEQRRRKRAGIKPPPMPIIQPIAHRPDSLAQIYHRRYTELLERYDQELPETVKQNGLELAPGKRRVTADMFDAALGI